MSADTRLKLGIVLLVLGLAMPAGTLFIIGTDWPAGVKAAIRGTLLFAPDIMAVAAVALMGKENFEHIVERVKSGLKSFKPAGNVSRSRHAMGLILSRGPYCSPGSPAIFPL